MNTLAEKDVYSVFVDGAEVSSFLMEKEKAANLGREYLEDGYKKVYVLNYETNKFKKITK